MTDQDSQRLDAFTHAAFAFAVSLLVIGGARAPEDVETLLIALGDIPAHDWDGEGSKAVRE